MENGKHHSDHVVLSDNRFRVVLAETLYANSVKRKICEHRKPKRKEERKDAVTGFIKHNSHFFESPKKTNHTIELLFVQNVGLLGETNTLEHKK